jgi:hypothetical protein
LQLALLIPIFIFLLTSCSGTSQTSEEEIAEYKSAVLDILIGDPLLDTGAGQIIDITIGDLGCEGDLCIASIRFQFLSDDLRGRKSLIADYRARICKPEMAPPNELKTEYQLICDELQELLNALDAIELNSRTATTMVRTGGSDEFLNEISDRIASQKTVIANIRNELRAIDFLLPMFFDR